ncbi:hypothetical protein EON65_17585 [archaeon]|nr:MAG: hypothetical protein EON65_17585 [archaeon]
MEEKASLLREHDIDWMIVKIPSTGLRHYSGISSTYSCQFPAEALKHVMTREEFLDVITRLNETIRDYWPCNPVYYLGYGCCLCTLGLSVLIPNYCISHSEVYATAMLRNISLKARYYDKNISFTLKKTMCNSYVEIRFPAFMTQGVPEEEGLGVGGVVGGVAIATNAYITSQPRLKEL